MKPDYRAYREAQIKDGLLFQDFVVDVAYKVGLVIVQYASRTYQLNFGESRTGVEIKHDKIMATTGNLWIETAEKAMPRPGPYAVSGIHRADHWLYAIGDYDVIFFLASNWLRAMDKATKDGRPRYKHCPNKTKTSQGFLLPIQDARRYAVLILEPMASGRVAKHVNDLAKMATELRAVIEENPSQRSLWDFLSQEKGDVPGCDAM